MRFGICTSVANAASAKAAGWDFVEENVQNLLQGLLPDADWRGAQAAAASALQVPAANVLVPANLKITGPDADLERLQAYMTVVISRARKIGVRTLVFGSGGARNVPDGFDRGESRRQIIDFAAMAAPVAAEQGVTIVAEPLNRGECNIINSVAEAMEYVRAVDHPNFRCLVDSYHFWLEDERLEDLAAAMPFIRHVHLADKEGRVPPGESGMSDYRPFFGVIKRAGYDSMISVESPAFKDIAGTGRRVLEFVKKQWAEA